MRFTKKVPSRSGRIVSAIGVGVCCSSTLGLGFACPLSSCASSPVYTGTEPPPEHAKALYPREYADSFDERQWQRTERERELRDLQNDAEKR
jgi:hypothetical protein